MPTTLTDSADPASGRVTRSLRKRLTSIDSDASSRPGTPIISHLHAISETLTPSKRTTRRASSITPAATPSKGRNRLENVEVYNSPARRSTRRRSVSIQEEEQFSLQTKSLEPSVDVVKEEESTDKTPNAKIKRVTRLSSKSPTESLSMQSKLNTTKGVSKKLLNKSTEQEEAKKEDEVIDLSDCSESAATTSSSLQSNKHTKVMIKKEKNIDEMIVELTNPQKQSELNSLKKKNTKISNKMSDEAEPTFSKVATEQQTPQKEQSSLIKSTPTNQPTPVKTQVQKNSPEKRKSMPKVVSGVESSSGNSSAELETSKPETNIVPSSPARESRSTQKQNRKSGVESSGNSPAELEISKQKANIVPSSPAKEISSKDSRSTQKQNRKSGVESSPGNSPAELKTSKPEAHIVPSSPAKEISSKDSRSTQKQNRKSGVESSPGNSPVELETSNQEANIVPSSPAKEISSKDSRSTQKQNRKSGVESSPGNSPVELETSNQEANIVPSSPAKETSSRENPQIRNSIGKLSLRKPYVKLEDSHQENLITSTKKTNEHDSSPQKKVNLEELCKTSVEQSSPTKTQLKQGSPQKKTRPENLKNVCFNESAENDAIKSVFPKTPGLTKSKSYILDTSKDGDKGNDEIQEQSFRGADKSAKKNIDHEEILNTKTPYKLNLKALKCSTPIQNESPKINKTSDEEAKSVVSAKETEDKQEVLQFPKSWSQSVSGTVVETAKIDCIQSEETKQKQLAEEEAAKKLKNQSKKKRYIVDDSDEDDDDLLEEDDDCNEVDVEEEEENQEKSIFFDDEAMEVPEGEESIDSEERAYLEENEVPVYGESIGSSDSEDDEDEEEPDEEDEAFIVSDTEEVMHAVDFESDLDDNIDNKSKQRKYKRIIKNSESSNEGGKYSEEENKEICLLLESSAEETHIDNKNQDKTESSGDEIVEVKAQKEGKSLKMKGDDDKEEKADETSMIKSPSKRKLMKKLEQDETETNSEENEQKVNKKTPRKSLNKANDETEKYKDSEREDKATKKSLRTSKLDKTPQKTDSDVEMAGKEDRKIGKSPRASKLNKSLPNDDSDVEMDTGASKNEGALNSPRKLKHENELENLKRKSLNKTKQDVSQDKNDSVNDDQEESAMKPSSNISTCEENQGDVTTATAQKRKSTNKTVKDNENKEENTANTSQKESRKSLKRASIEVEANQSAEDLNTSKRTPRKSMNKSYTVAVSDESDDVEIPNEEKKARKSLSRSKEANVSLGNSTPNENVTDDENNTSLKQTRKSLNRSKKAYVSVGNSEANENATANDEENNVSLKQTRKSLNRSKKANVSVGNSEANVGDNEEVNVPNEENNTSLKQTRKCLNRSKKANVSVGNSEANENATDDDEEKNMSLKQTRKSLNRSKKANVSVDESVIEGENQDVHTKKTLNVSKRESLNSSKNNKHKSLIRTSTEETNAEEKEHLHQNRSVEDGFEPEETLTASEIPSETSAGRSLNSSKRSMKSLNRSKLSLENYDDANISHENDGNSEKASENDDDAGTESEEARFSDVELDDHESRAEERSAIMEFLGEEESESPSPTQKNLNSSQRKSANKTKFNETFEWESTSNSVQVNESLSRSLMRKSLNLNQLQRERKEKNRNETLSEDHEADNSTDSPGKEKEVLTKLLPDRGLSVSLSKIERKKEAKGDKETFRNSFTIGVSVRNTPSADAAARSSSSDSDKSENENVLSEEEDLEKIKNVARIGPYKSRNSLSMSLKTAPLNPEESKQQKRIKRTSLYLQEQSASQSFVENIAEEKKRVETKKKKNLNSFSEVEVASSVENEIQPEQTKSEKKQNKALSSDKKANIKRILSRCDDILEAANLAKREAKINAKKSKVKKPKWMDKEEKTSNAEDEVKIPLVSKKQIKRKEKIKKEMAKAMKHQSATLKSIDPKLMKEDIITEVIETKQVIKSQSSSKRFPTELLETLENGPSQPKRREPREIETTPPSDKENSKKSSNKNTHTITDIPLEKKKKKHDKKILKTATGTVIVEPSTPEKLRCQHGFRESPKTPIGFKIEDIHSAGRNEREKLRKRGKNIFTASGAFVEEDLSSSTIKVNTKKDKSHKRKRHIEEPLYSLPKTQWTTSGVFVEEDLYCARPLANSTATQFMVTSLNGSKKLKTSSKVVSSTTLNSASNFKKAALFNDKVRRETSRELIHRKQRKLANNHY